MKYRIDIIYFGRTIDSFESANKNEIASFFNHKWKRAVDNLEKGFYIYCDDKIVSTEEATIILTSI